MGFVKATVSRAVRLRECPLTLFRPGVGGKRILPAATLDVNFFNKGNATKLGEFFQNLSVNNLI